MMDVFGIQIPYKALTNFELENYAKQLNLNLRGVFMRDNLPELPLENECGIVNFNRTDQPGSHWVGYYKKGHKRIYFDSYGQAVLQEVRNYLGSPIYRNTDIVQEFNTPLCGHLTLFILKSLDLGKSFRDSLNSIPVTGSGITWTNQLANELHRGVRKHFQKRHVFSRHVDDIFGADIVYMNFPKQNKGFKYILMVIDVFSKYGWAVALKTKTGIEVSGALSKIFDERTPKKLWVDRGSEFYNTNVDKLLKKHNIEIYSTNNDEKCSVIERWNRTIKRYLWKYFTANSTHKWIDILQALITRYNTKDIHRSIGMTPAKASLPENYNHVFRNLYGEAMKERGKAKYRVGQKVRLAVHKDHFEKSYIINWSDKVYIISQVLTTRPATYIVEDDKGNRHKGTFYAEELQKVKADTFRVQKVLKYKTVNGKKFALVRWMEHDSSYDSWEPV